jgi:outer membrane beta-barrel protein
MRYNNYKGGFMLNLLRALIAILFLTSVGHAKDYEAILDRMDELRRRTEMRSLESPLFSKKMRLEFTPTFGMNTSDPYMDVYLYGLSIRGHIWDSLAIEGMMLMASTSETAVTTYMNNDGFANKPVASKMESMSSISLVLTPIYAKMSVLANFILHYDMFFTGGIGQTKTNWESASTYNLGIGAKVWIYKWFSFTAELRDFIHKEQRESENISKHNVTLLFGTNIFLF